MDVNSRFNYWFLGSTTFVFVAVLLVYHHQQSNQVDKLKSQLAKLSQELEAATAAAPAIPPTPEALPQAAPVEQQNQEPPSAQPSQAMPSASPQSGDAAQIEKDDHEIAALEARLSNLNQAGDQKLEIDGRIAATVQSINDVDLKLKAMQEQSNTAPPEIPLRDLRAQKVDLENQLQQLNLQKSQATTAARDVNAQDSGQATAEKDRIRAQEEDIRRRISDLQVERTVLVRKQQNTLAQ